MKYKTLYIITVSILSLGILNSCTERIDIELEQEYTRLAVEGYITPGGSTFQYIHLTTTAGYFSNEAPPLVSGATVTVEDGTNIFLFDEDKNYPGYYLAPFNFEGAIEKTYQLKIDLAEEIAGEKHFEASETMPSLSADIDSTRAVYIPERGRWAIEFYGYDPPGPNFYMFNGLRNGTLLTDTVWKMTVTDDKLFDGNYVYGAYVMVLDSSELKPSDQFTLVTSSITEEYYIFIIELQTEISMNIPLFSGPPANVSTNLNKGAVGYFAAFSSDFTETIVPER
ncbi:MAG: hypothetical protein DRI89_00420 [Bacteroidetes bacterium]|nr:MAG: hypothetical protein DRI89_00420 [Bacteroidota bacterium]